nr:hypothetical protein [Candidatus Freyarchaeota archaeon]
MGQLVAAGIPEKDVAELLGVTRTFVETAVRTLAARLDLPAPRLKGDLVVLFLDGFYGSRIAVLVGKAGRHVLWTFRGGEHPDHTLPPRKDQEEPAGGSHARRGDPAEKPTT